MAEVVAIWAPHIARAVGPQTAKRYACSMGQLEPFIAGKYLDQIDGRLVAEYIQERAKDGVTNATIKRDLVALSSVMNHAIDQGWIENNPVIPRMRRLKERRDPIVLPSHRDIDLVISRCPEALATMTLAACRTGARQDELVKATCDGIDHGRRQLAVRGKGNKVRVIDLVPFDGYEPFRSLRASVGLRRAFTHHGGASYKNVSSQFSAIVKRVAKWAKANSIEFTPFRFHDLRHRHAVDWLKSGRSIYDLQQRLGHSSIKVTEIYLDYLTPEERRIAMYGQRVAQKGAQSVAIETGETASTPAVQQ
jgi:integrase/recombinase XerD